MEAELRELEAVAATFGSSSRLQRLLTYIGEKYFRGETDLLHEYDIATQVFGRSTTNFNAGEDAIVRVEAHRLRKRLKEYYQGEGKDHPIQLSIPLGTYVPVFIHRTPEIENVPTDIVKEVHVSPVVPQEGRPRRFFTIAITLLVLIAAGCYAIFFQHKNRKQEVTAISSGTSSPSYQGPYAQVPLRILAGYSGKPQTDSAGKVWLPDEYNHYGGNWYIPADSIGRTSDPMLFEHWRNGQFSYDIPLRPGTYELHLYFLAQDQTASEPSTFSISLNGAPLLTGFDVDSDAMGTKIADERVFRDISPGSDGYLRLAFTGDRVTAAVNAIEILPGIPHRQLPIRIAMRPTSFTDHSGQFWRPDDYYLGGYASVKRVSISGTPDPDLFDAERYGHFSYAIPVDTRDRYTLILHFAELYFGAKASGTGGEGSRVFRVLCNGNTLLDNFDMYKEAGSLHAITKTFYHLKPTAQGKLNIMFEPMVNNATVSGIEVIDESK